MASEKLYRILAIYKRVKEGTVFAKMLSPGLQLEHQFKDRVEKVWYIKTDEKREGYDAVYRSVD